MRLRHSSSVLLTSLTIALLALAHLSCRGSSSKTVQTSVELPSEEKPSESRVDSSTEGSLAELDVILARSLELGLVAGVLHAESMKTGDRWISAAGVRDLQSKELVQTDDRFRLASITKLFTAAAVLKLRDNRELQLSDSISSYISGRVLEQISGFDEVTIAQLLSHSSGLADFSTGKEFWSEVFSGRGLNRNLTPLESLEFANGKAPLSPPVDPGEGSFYSNTNYFLLGLLIEKVTGQSYSEAVESLVAQPLGLDSIGMENDSAIIVSSFTIPDSGGSIEAGMKARGVDQLREDGLVDLTRIYERYNAWAFAAGGLSSNAQDLAKFAVSIKGDFLSPESRAVFRSIFSSEQDGTTYFGGSGGADGISTILLEIDDRWRIVVLTNTTGIPDLSSGRIFWEAVEALNSHAGFTLPSGEALSDN